MQHLQQTKTHNPLLLVEQLNSGIPALVATSRGVTYARYTYQLDGTTIILDFPDDVSLSAVQAVIDAHVSTQLTAEQQTYTTNRTNALNLYNALKSDTTNWATLTADQKDQAILQAISLAVTMLQQQWGFA